MDRISNIELLHYLFQVGDDVRQDMLALQLMQIMKNVWAGLGIPVSVFPYRYVNWQRIYRVITLKTE